MQISGGKMERLRYAEAAEFLGVSVPTLKLWVVKKKIPHYKVGNTVQFDTGDLEKFIADSRVEAA